MELLESLKPQEKYTATNSKEEKMFTFGGRILRSIVDPVKKKTNVIVQNEREFEKEKKRRRMKNKMAKKSRRRNK